MLLLNLRRTTTFSKTLLLMNALNQDLKSSAGYELISSSTGCIVKLGFCSFQLFPDNNNLICVVWRSSSVRSGRRERDD